LSRLLSPTRLKARHVLSGLGVYGVAAHDVARSREIAIRLALGARPGVIRQLVTRVAVLPVIVGIAVGLLTLAVLVRR
jgi:hypothetical protein